METEHPQRVPGEEGDKCLGDADAHARVAHALMLVGSLPGYQSMVRKNSIYCGNTADIAVCLVVLFSCVYLILHGKSDPAADTRVTLAALTAGKHTGPARTVPAGRKMRAALGQDEAPADALVSRGCGNPNHATAILRRGFL